MPQDYEKFIGPDGVVRIGHSLTRRDPEPKAPEQPQQLQKAAKAAQQPVEAKTEQTFAQRLRSILELPAARNRQRQAVAIAAETAASPREAAAILATLPEDAAAGFAHGGTLFPGSIIQHDAEVQRILSIIRHPEAMGRERQALELATATSLALDQAVALLAGMPKVERSRIPTIAERAAREREFGASFEPVGLTKQEKTKQSWDRAMAKANASIGAPPKPQAATPAPPPEWSADVKKP